MRTGDGTADHLKSTADFDGGLDRGFELRAPRGQPHDVAPCTCFAMNPRTSPLRTGVIVLFAQIGAFSPKTQHPCDFQADGNASAGLRN